jgi:hypothetical protein
MLNLGAIRSARVNRDPFVHFVTQDVVPADAMATLGPSFPHVVEAGSYPISQFRCTAGFQTLVDELRSDEFARAVGDVLGSNLVGLPQLITVRGWSGTKDGFVHTDAEWKVVTVLLYLNAEWRDARGCLRLLRSSALDDVAVEVPPRWGTLIAFQRSDRSYHGHELYIGERRLVQVNWASDARYVIREERRHRRSAILKGVLRTAARGWLSDAHRDR